MSSRTLYVTDLDGTLLGPDSRVSARSAAIMRRLGQSGVMVTAATARTPATVQPLLADCGITTAAVVMTGAALWHFGEARYVDVCYTEPAVMQLVERLCGQVGIRPFVYALSGDCRMLHVYHSAECTKGEQIFISQRDRLALKEFHLGERLDDHLGSGMRPVLAFAMGPRDTVYSVARQLQQSGAPCSVSAYVDIFGDDVGILEVFAPGVSKAGALLRLKQKVGAERLVVFGDNLNDLPMFAVADSAYAVEGALPQVREAATAVIGPNSADAVPLTIARMAGVEV